MFWLGDVCSHGRLGSSFVLPAVVWDWTPIETETETETRQGGTLAGAALLYCLVNTQEAVAGFEPT